MSDQTFTDEELTSYLDEEASGALRREIDAAMLQDQHLRERLARLQIPREDVLHAFETLLGSAPDMEAFKSEKERLSKAHRRIVAGLAASLMIGVLLGANLFRGTQEPDWRDYVAAYQALYVNGTLANARTSEDNAQMVLAQLGKTIALDLAPAMSDPVLDFRRAQILGFEGQPLVQVAYLTPLGDPVALCIIKTDAAQSFDIDLSKREGMQSAAWSDGSHAYLLIGGEDADLISSAAQRFRDAL
ncbi:MAG: hypothetical protein AAGA12_12400 [Pseudomonadota bacterium]